MQNILFNRLLLLLSLCLLSNTLLSQDKDSALNDSYVIGESSSNFNDSVIVYETGNSGFSSLSEVLQGKIGGMDISSPSGDPGDGATYTFNGFSISGNSLPLVIVDGIPQRHLDDLYNFYNINGVSDIQSSIGVPLQDIQSLKILKNPAELALYGSEGSDGVILIETKRGNKDLFHFSYKTDFHFNLPTAFPELLSGDDYTMMMLESYHNAGYMIIPDELTYNPDNENFYNFSANTDWLDAITQNSYSLNHFLNIYGGSERSRYYLSLNYDDRTGEEINTGFTGLNARVNLDHAFSKKLTFSMNSSFNKKLCDRNYLLNKTLLETAYSKAPNMSIWEYDADGNLTGDYMLLNDFQGEANPVAISNGGESSKETRDFVGTAALRFKLNRNIGLSHKLSYLSSNAIFNSYLPYEYLYNYILVPGAYKYDAQITNTQVRNESQCKLYIPLNNDENHNIQADFSWIIEQNRLHENSELNPLFNDVSWTDYSGAFSIRYSLFNRYFFNINGRPETYYLNGENNWDFNYGASFRWKFTNERFAKNLGDGFEGSLIGEYARVTNNSDWIYLISRASSGEASELNSLQGGMELYFPEKKIFLEAGIYRQSIARFLNWPYATMYSHNTFSIDYAKEPFIDYINRGINVTANIMIVQTKDFEWSGNFTTSWNELVIDKFHGANGYFSPNMLGWGEYQTQLVEGSPADLIYGLWYEGVYSDDEEAYARNEDGTIIVDEAGAPVPVYYQRVGNYPFNAGDARFFDKNYDGIIDINDTLLLGNTVPRIRGGISNHISYKNLSLVFNLYYRFGYQIINSPALAMESMSTNDNQYATTNYRWRKWGDETIIHRAERYHPAHNLGSDMYIEPGGFIKLNYVHLAYSLPEATCDKLHLDDITFILSAKRIYTLTGYSGIDPEISSNFDAVFSSTRDYIRYPAPRVVSLSIRVGL